MTLPTPSCQIPRKHPLRLLATASLALALAALACGGGSGKKMDAGTDGATDKGTPVDRPDVVPAEVGPDLLIDLGQGANDGGDDTGGPDTDTTDATVCPPAPGAVDGGATAAVTDNVTFHAGVTVATLAGGGTAGTMDGPMATATFSNPVSVAIEAAGTLLVCDWDSNLVRRVTADGTVSTLVMQNNFRGPFGFAQVPAGALYVATDYNTTGQKTPASGTVWRVDPTTGAATVVIENVGRPRGLLALASGQLVLADYQNQRLRLLNPTTAAVTDLAGVPGCPGYADGMGANARLGVPYGIAAMPDGKIVVADYDNHVLRMVTADGDVTTFAGSPTQTGSVDGPRASARFVSPQGVAVDGAGNIFVSDPAAHRIRRIAADGTVTTVAGDGTAGFKDGTGAEAQFRGQEGIAVSTDGKTLYVADGTSGEAVPFHRVRKLTLP